MIKIIKKRQRKDGYATIFHCIDFSHLKNKKFSCFSFGLLRVFFGKTPLFSKKTRRSIEEDPKDSNTRVVKCGQMWTNMVKYGQTWTNMDKTGQIWSIVVKLIILFFYKFIIVYHSLCKKCPNLKPNYLP